MIYACGLAMLYSWSDSAMKRAIPTLFPCLLVPLAVLAGGCDRKPPFKVDLTRRSDLPAAAIRGSRPATLRVAVSAMVSPAATFGSYEALVRLIGRRLGEDVALVQRRTYAEVNALLREGGVDMAFVCTGAFVAGEGEFGLEAVAVPVVRGKTTYRSLVIVRAGDRAAKFPDLRGRAFAFTDPLSNTGRLYPLLLLEKAEAGRANAPDKATPDEFFSRTFFTGSHDRSVEAVRDGLVDAAAVDSLVFNALTVEPEARRRFKIVDTSPEFGMPPVVVSPRVEEADKNRIAACLLSLGSDEESKKILAGTGIERFVKPVSSWYDSVRDMRRALKRAGLLEK